MDALTTGLVASHECIKSPMAAAFSDAARPHNGRTARGSHYPSWQGVTWMSRDGSAGINGDRINGLVITDPYKWGITWG